MIFSSTDIPGHGYDEGLGLISLYIGARGVEEVENIGIFKCSDL